MCSADKHEYIYIYRSGNRAKRAAQSWKGEVGHDFLFFTGWCQEEDICYVMLYVVFDQCATGIHQFLLP